MADVFISYAREDLERVRPLVGAIEGAGYQRCKNFDNFTAL